MPDAFGEQNNKYESTYFYGKHSALNMTNKGTIIVEPSANTWKMVNVNESNSTFFSPSISK